MRSRTSCATGAGSFFALFCPAWFAQAFTGRYLEGAIGAGASAAILYGLTRPRVRALFKTPERNVSTP